jgi:hypothetical protein
MARGGCRRYPSVVWVVGLIALVHSFGYAQQSRFERQARVTNENALTSSWPGKQPLVNTDAAVPHPSPESSAEEATKTSTVEQPPAVGESKTAARIIPKSLTFINPKKLTPLDRAYLDAFTILREENSCSRLYGGSHAIIALNEMVGQLHPTYMDRLTGVRMSGATTMRLDSPTGLTFRLFEKAELNLDGLFYRGNSLYSAHIPSIGIFQPNTREARVTVLLHELGHLVRRANKKWVLPDDGNDPDQSRENTARVIAVCRKQIEDLSKISLEEELKKTRPEVEIAASATGDSAP